MKSKTILKITFIILGIVIPLVIVIFFAVNDMGALFDSWTASDVNPGWRYVWLIIFKLTIYLFPPLLGMIGFYIENKDNVNKHRFLYYFIKALNMHFLVLLCIKLFADSILELDSIWGLKLFNSIKDVQTLIGYVITLLIKQNIKVEPGMDNPKKLVESEEKNQ